MDLTDPEEMTSAALCVGHHDAGAGALANALGVPLIAPPSLNGAVLSETVDSGVWAWTEAVDEWANELAAGDPLDRAALVTWVHEPSPERLTDLTDDVWFASVEHQLALWARAIVAVADRANPGASIVVLVDRPSALDAFGHAAALAVAEGLRVFSRSAALVHGERMVRINTITTSLNTPPDGLTGMAPALQTFPGTIESEVAGAVRALWSPDTVGVSGTVLAVDGGRSW